MALMGIALLGWVISQGSFKIGLWALDFFNRCLFSTRAHPLSKMKAVIYAKLLQNGFLCLSAILLFRLERRYIDSMQAKCLVFFSVFLGYYVRVFVWPIHSNSSAIPKQ